MLNQLERVQMYRSTFLMSFKFLVGGIREELVLLLKGSPNTNKIILIIETMLYAMQWGFVNILRLLYWYCFICANCSRIVTSSNFWQTNHRLGSAMLSLLRSWGITSW